MASTTWLSVAFVVVPVGYPFFESVHCDFELVECVGVGNSDVAFAEWCECGAWDDGDSGFIEKCGRIVRMSG